MDNDESISAYVTADYEGISSDFTEIEQMSSRGYCDIYKAKRYGRFYMLKCLKAELSFQPVYQQMLRKEFEILMLLQHHAVMEATGVEQVVLPGHGTTLCLVAEWIEGRTLAEYLGEHPTRKQQQRVAKALAEAVAYIHSQQVVHRDLKPSNIMVTHNGDYVKIIDFGLADTSSHAILKQPAGTMQYMAPEQMQTAVADVRNDIYSLGVIMQEMDLGGGKYRKVVSRCLKPIAQRYQQMDELLGDLNSRRQQYSAWAIAASLVLAVIMGLVWQITKLNQRAALLQEEAKAQAIQFKILNHEIIGFADTEAKRICVKNWDTDSDGELSYEEAAAADSLGKVFKGNTRLRSFDELEHFTGLEAIDAEAFMGCTALQSVRIPSSVRFIRHDAFRKTALQRFVFPGPVAGLGDHFLEDCPKLETVIFEARLPQNNMTDESRPFVNCPKLSAIFVPNYEIKYLLHGKQMIANGYTIEMALNANYSYNYCLWLQWGSVFPLMTDHIPFADPEVERICVKWWDRDGDRQLSIDEAVAVKTLASAFTGNPDITTFNELKYFTGIEAINNSAFESCINLTALTLPSSVKVISSYAFHKCSHLTSITLPQRLKDIEKMAFAFCDLKEIFIPDSVTHVASNSFHYNGNLRKVVVGAGNKVYDSRDNCNAIIETATNTMVTGSVTAVFPRTVDKMSDEPFAGFNRPSLTLPRQIKKIGQWAFASFIDTFYCESPVPPSYKESSSTMLLLRPVIVIPKGSREAYSKASGWRHYTDCFLERAE